MSRGRQSATPLNIPAKGWLDILWRVFNKIGQNRIGLVAAGIAFYGLLALFPSITAAVAITGVIFEPSALLQSAGWLMDLLPKAVEEMISSQFTEVASADEQSLGLAAFAALAFALWSASKGTGSFIEGLNVIYEEDEERGFIKVKMITLLLTLALIVGLIASILIVAAIPTALTLLAESQLLKDAAMLLRWPAMLVVGIFGIAVLYRYAPSRREAQWKWLSVGAVAACLLWTLATVGFAFYVQSFATYNETFGALGGVVIMLTWLWISAFVVLLGAQLDAEIEAQTKVDTTIGPCRPMGERGATKADTLGESFGEKDNAA